MRVWSFEDGHWVDGERGDGPYWFDLHHGDAEKLRDLARRFGLHHLAVEDCLSPYFHTPKLEEFEEYLFIILGGMSEESEQPELEELDIFLGKQFLITYHDPATQPPAIAGLTSALRARQTVRPFTSGLFYEVADRAVDAIIPRVIEMGELLDDAEETILNGADARDTNRRVLARRTLAGNLRRMLAPQQQAMLRLGRDEFPMIPEPARPYFRDVYDHLLRVDLMLEEIREDTEVALSMYLSSLNNRLSEVMKVLAVVSALALPGTLITGIFGTNFDNVPGLHSNWGFALMMLAIAGSAAGMGLYFQRRGWF